MSYIGFHEYFPDLAKKETRTVTIMKDDCGVPKGDYELIELYCNDLNCDCRRVFLEVFSPNFKESIATIAYGWEDNKFYAKWSGITKNDKMYSSIVYELKGPILNLLSKQSKYAPAMLDIIENVVLKDIKYVNRLKKHYKLFKEIVNKPNAPIVSTNTTGRNEPCPCGSGKKYKKCCMDFNTEY